MRLVVIQITPLAADSMGTRSMATFIETGDTRLVIDPFSELAPLKYRLAPHPVELWRHKVHRERIGLYCGAADVIVCTHFPADPVLFAGARNYRRKLLLLKNPNSLSDRDQRKRAFEFIKSVRAVAGEIRYVDGRTVKTGDTVLAFSGPFPSNIREGSGSFIQLTVREREHTFHFSSIVRGPWQDETAEHIIGQDPDSLYLDGPGRSSADGSEESSDEVMSFDDGVVRIKWIMEKTRVAFMILDHHLMRHPDWKDGIKPLYRFAAEKGILLQTAAEARGEPVQALESRRRQLYELDYPESEAPSL